MGRLHLHVPAVVHRVVQVLQVELARLQAELVCLRAAAPGGQGEAGDRP